MKRIVMVVLAVTLAGGAAQAHTDTPRVVRSGDATVQDYRQILRMLRGIDRSLDELDAMVAGRAGGRWQPECRGYSPEKTVRCAAVKFDPPGGATQAISVWQCESNFGTEPSPGDGHIYHGPFQFLYSTYASQQASMPDIVDWNELSPAVHDMRSNILTAVAWAARNSWSPWSCAG
jgi:hypothetical protein